MLCQNPAQSLTSGFTLGAREYARGIEEVGEDPGVASGLSGSYGRLGAGSGDRPGSPIVPTVMPWKIIRGRDVDGPGDLGVLVRSSSTVANCPVRAIWRRTAPACVITPWPSTRAWPASERAGWRGSGPWWSCRRRRSSFQPPRFVIMWAGARMRSWCD